LPTIAQQQKGKDPQWVKAWLQAPHPPMPNFNLSRQEIDDVAAYLAALPQQ
jgi:mono/diheme cytochrome c family protein